MASTSHDESIESVMDDLQLHHVLLKSLEEEEPDAIDERDDILDEIERLEKKLADLRKDRFKNILGRERSPVRAAASDKSVRRAQLDGGFDLDPPDFPGPSKPSDMSYPLRPSQHKRPSQPSSVAPSKRPHQSSDLGEDPERALKRPYLQRSIPSSPSILPARSQVGGFYSDASDDIDGADSLRQLLGLDDTETLRELQEEQRKAEQWLEERKEQERRDAEYARMLQEGLYEPPRPDSATSVPHGNSGLLSSSRPASPSIALDRSQGAWSSNFSPLRPANPYAGGPSYSNHSHLLSSFRPTNTQISRNPYSTSLSSSDSDLAEITPLDFQNSIRHPHGYKEASRSGQTAYPQPYTWANNSSLSQAMPPYPSMDPIPSRSAAKGFNSLYSPSAIHRTMERINPNTLLERFRNPALGGALDPTAALEALEEYRELNSSGDFDDYKGDPRKAREEIKQLLETIRPDLELSAQSREGTPEALKFNLMEHQKVGLTWMKSMEESDKKGGILADDMGLGKTIQALALIVSRLSTDPAQKTTLIIAPVSLMHQWKREIHRMLKPGRHQLSVYILHGDKRHARFANLKSYDVVLTTFGTMASELNRSLRLDKMEKEGYGDQTAARVNTLPVIGPRSKWHRVIIDEAQCIKNRNTKAALACCHIDATYRWCMTGTPMMNNVGELHSLLKFLRIRPYCYLEKFNADFTRPLKSGGEEQTKKAMMQLQVLLKAVLLRRTKNSKIDGRPILQLPARISEKVHAVFSEDERQLYDALETRTQLQFNKYLRNGTVGRNYSHVLVLLLRLRQACCHPHLMNDFSVEVTSETQDLDLTVNAKRFSQEVIVRLKDNDNIECPICIDAVDNPIIFFPCGHSACSECFSRMTDPTAGVMQGNDGVVEVKCPNCRAKIDPKKITDRTSFRKIHFPDESTDATPEENEPAVPSEDEGDESDCDSDSDDDSLSRFIVDDDDEDSSSRKKKSRSKGKQVGKPKKSLAELKKDSSKNIASKRKYLRRLEKTWVTSAKIEKTMEILQEIQSRGEGEKTIIFSQFTSLLDLLEIPIIRKGWGFRRYDGSMKPGDRNSAVIDFTDNPNCKIMLVSLKAGNSGLNLVAASQVIIFDPFWNPYIEEQAIDRAHRIGQVRQVSIHRILVENTVEDRILELQDKKRELIEGALDENASKNLSRLGTRELAYLFGVN